jgi:hypothetical protein
MRETNYFSYFNKTISNGQIITNLLNRAKIKNTDVIIKSKLYLPYFIKDGERPETLAESVYGSTSYFWIILFANNIRNIYEDWPRTQECLDEYVTYKYGTLAEAKLEIHHYEDDEGLWIVYEDWLANWASLTNTNARVVSCYEYEDEKNESKRLINLIRPEYKSQLVMEFQKIFK